MRMLPFAGLLLGSFVSAASAEPLAQPSAGPVELTEREILCDFRPGAGIRIGPHYFTSDAELEYVIAQIVEIVETGAHLPHLGAVAQH